jgi:hypothetical protein
VPTRTRNPQVTSHRSDGLGECLPLSPSSLALPPPSPPPSRRRQDDDAGLVASWRARTETDGRHDRGDWSCDVACARRVCRRWSGEVTWARTWRVHRQRPAEAMWHARGGYGIGGLGSRCGARERAPMQQRRRLRGMVDEVRSLCRFIAMNVLVAVRRGEGGAGRAAVTVGADVVNTGRDAAAPAIVRTVRRLLWMPLLLLSIIPSWGCRCC